MDESWATRGTRRTRRILNLPVVTINGQRKLNEFFTALSDNAKTNRLHIHDCYIYVDTANSLSVALSKMSELSTFELESCNSDTKGMAILASSLADRGSITSLRFSRCYIVSQEIRAIADAYRNKGSLQVLDFWNNSIDADGIVSLALLLTNNSSIKTLKVKVSGNNGDGIILEGITALARAVAANQTLQCLHINGLNTEEKHQKTLAAFEKVIYDDESMESVITNSNHTLKALHFDDIYSCSVFNTKSSLMGLNEDSSEKAVQRKTVRFLNERPLSIVSTNVGKNLIPSILSKVGRVCRLNSMFELVRNMPDLFASTTHSRKRSRP